LSHAVNWLEENFIITEFLVVQTAHCCHRSGFAYGLARQSQIHRIGIITAWLQDSAMLVIAGRKMIKS
jgi:hypothetical protein